MTEARVRKLARADGEHIAYLRREGKTPGVVWLGGFHSDMAGTKAEALDAWAERPPRVIDPDEELLEIVGTAGRRRRLIQ